MKRLHLAASVLLLVFAVACSSSDSPESPVKKAQKEIDQHRAVLAQKELEKELEKDPESSEIRYQLARSIEKQGLIYDALHQYIHINTKDPLFSPAFESAARILNRIGDDMEALDRAHFFADLLNEDPWARLLVARLHLDLDHSGRARAIIDTAQTLGLPEAVADLVRAEALARDHKFDSASQIADRAIASGDNSPWFYRQAADYVESVGLVDSAVDLSQRSLAEDDPQDIFLNDHFQRLLRVNYFWDAEQFIDSLAAANRPPTLISVLQIQLQIAADEDAEAEAAIAKLSTQVSLNLTRLMYELLTDVITGNLLTIQESAAGIMRHMSQFDYSDEFKQIMAWQIALPTARYGEQVDGLDYIQLVRGQRANMPEVRLTHTELLFKTGQFEEGFKQLATLHRFHQREPDWLTGMAEIGKRRDTVGTDRAIEYYREALALDEWYRPAFEGFVDLYRQEREFDKALSLFDTYAHFVRHYPACAITQSFVLTEDRQFDRAMRMFSDHIPHLSEDMTRWREMQFVMQQYGYEMRWPRLAEMAAELNADNVEALMFAAEIMARNEDAGRVEELATHAAGIDANDPEPKAMLAYALYLDGDTEQALSEFEQLRTEYRDNPFVMTYYSLLLARTGQNPTLAADMARRAMFGYESNFRSRMHLCRIYYMTGRFDLCIGEARKAISQYRNHFLPYFWSGKAGAKLHRDDVSENLNKSIELGLYGERLEEARQLLAKI